MSAWGRGRIQCFDYYYGHSNDESIQNPALHTTTVLLLFICMYNDCNDCKDEGRSRTADTVISLYTYRGWESDHEIWCANKAHREAHEVYTTIIWGCSALPRLQLFSIHMDGIAPGERLARRGNRAQRGDSAPGRAALRASHSL